VKKEMSMIHRGTAFIALTTALALAACSKPADNTQAAAATAPPLTLAGTTDVPNYKGDFDHFAVDEKGNRVFLAGEENHELEVFDRTSGAIVKRLPGFGVPHSLHFMPAANELLVIDGEKPSPVLDAATLKVKRTYNLAKGADSFGVDPNNQHLWIVSGGKDVPQADSNLTEVDPATGKTGTNIHFDANHVEAMAMESNGPRLFISVNDKNTMAVIDRKAGTFLAQWPIKEAEQNAPLAFDEKNHRLFVITRKPGKLIVVNSDTGATVAVFKAPERTDQIVWDPGNRRIYVTGGEGYIGVFEQDDADHYREAAKVTSLPGAKTAILDTAQHRLWVAASPGETGAMGKLMWFDVAPR
jgi:DNA-binding beta-propeller fold protein YncE